MSEPSLLPSAVAAARQESLWDKAPGWRNLTIAATALTFAALALPLGLPQQTNSVPPVQVKAAPAHIVAELPHVQTPPPVTRAVARIPGPSQSTVSSQEHLLTPPTGHHAVAPREQTASLAVQPAPALATDSTNVCPITLSPQAQPMGGGVVIGFEGALAAQQRMAANERLMGGPINPAFANTPRAIVRTDGSSPGGPSQIVVLPPGMIVGIGDHIAFNGIHRDMTMPCGYAPPLVTADSGPSQPAANLQPAANAQAMPQ